MESFRFSGYSTSVRRKPLLIITWPSALSYKCLLDGFTGTMESTIRHILNEHIKQRGGLVVHHCALCDSFTARPPLCRHTGCPRISCFEYLPTEIPLPQNIGPGLHGLLFPGSKSRPCTGVAHTFGGSLVPPASRPSLLLRYPGPDVLPATSASPVTRPHQSAGWDEEAAAFAETTPDLALRVEATGNLSSSESDDELRSIEGDVDFGREVPAQAATDGTCAGYSLTPSACSTRPTTRTR